MYLGGGGNLLFWNNCLKFAEPFRLCNAPFFFLSLAACMWSAFYAVCMSFSLIPWHSLLHYCSFLFLKKSYLATSGCRWPAWWSLCSCVTCSMRFSVESAVIRTTCVWLETWKPGEQMMREWEAQVSFKCWFRSWRENLLINTYILCSFSVYHSFGLGRPKLAKPVVKFLCLYHASSNF